MAVSTRMDRDTKKMKMNNIHIPGLNLSKSLFKKLRLLITVIHCRLVKVTGQDRLAHVYRTSLLTPPRSKLFLRVVRKIIKWISSVSHYWHENGKKGEIIFTLNERNFHEEDY